MADSEAPVARHWEQVYRGVSLKAEQVVFLAMCEGCGAYVGDTAQHDRFHQVTRGIVGPPST